MKVAQKAVLIVGLATVLLMALFPPWRFTGTIAVGTVSRSLGYHSLFISERDLFDLPRFSSVSDGLLALVTFSVDIPRLSLQALVVVAGAGLLTLLLGVFEGCWVSFKGSAGGRRMTDLKKIAGTIMGRKRLVLLVVLAAVVVVAGAAITNWVVAGRRSVETAAADSYAPATRAAAPASGEEQEENKGYQADEAPASDSYVAPTSAAPGEELRETAEKDEREAYLPYVVLQNLRVNVGKTASEAEGIWGEIKNRGNRTLSHVWITVYCFDKDGRPVFEETYLPVTNYAPSAYVTNGPHRWEDPRGRLLKPNYAEKFEYHPDLGDVPLEWTGEVRVEVTGVSFSK